MLFSGNPIENIFEKSLIKILVAQFIKYRIKAKTDVPATFSQFGQRREAFFN